VKFVLVDRIEELEIGRRIVAFKALSLAEEYLADHFPRFPVLPGVFMLEAMVQASAWLARASLEFAPALVVLREARNVTYRSFLGPGRVLRIESQCREMAPECSDYLAHGLVEGREIVKARLTLRHLNLADTDPAMADVDERIRTSLRAQFRLLWPQRSDAASLGGG
jgi:3-hydroxyacyl-[acyl-carrier-protein] dehydratase